MKSTSKSPSIPDISPDFGPKDAIMTLESFQKHMEEYLRQLLATQPPTPPPIPEPDPVRRMWMPQAGCQAGWVRVLARHPALERFFQNVPAFKVPPSSHTGGWGRQNRLPSLKADRITRAASNIEMDQLLECELDPTVEAFCEQPFRIQYKLQGVRRSYTPDLLIFHHRPPHEVREIKPEKKAAEPDNERRWPAIGQALNSLGFSFQVYTERHLRLRSAAVREIFRDRHALLPSPAALDAIKFALRQESITIDEACARFSLTTQQVHALVRKLFFQLADFDAPLGPDCQIKLGPGLTRWTGRKQFRDI